MVIHTTCPRHPSGRCGGVGDELVIGSAGRILSDQRRPFIVANLELLFELAVLARKGRNPFGVRFVARQGSGNRLAFGFELGDFLFELFATALAPT